MNFPSIISFLQGKLIQHGTFDLMIDGYRTWEAVLLGAIPIVLSSTLNQLYENAPIMIALVHDNLLADCIPIFHSLSHHESLVCQCHSSRRQLWIGDSERVTPLSATNIQSECRLGQLLVEQNQSTSWTVQTKFVTTITHFIDFVISWTAMGDRPIPLNYKFIPISSYWDK